MGSRWEWSIPQVAFNRYKAMGVSHLFIAQKLTGEIFVATLAEIEPHARYWHADDLDVGGTCFLPVCEYKRVATLL